MYTPATYIFRNNLLTRYHRKDREKLKVNITIRREYHKVFLKNHQLWKKSVVHLSVVSCGTICKRTSNVISVNISSIYHVFIDNILTPMNILVIMYIKDYRPVVKNENIFWNIILLCNFLKSERECVCEMYIHGNGNIYIFKTYKC